LRAVAFAIADGQLPSNTGAGYVIRRILRRAVRYGYSFLDLKEATIHTLMNGLDREMGEFYSEIRSQKELISKVIREEEDGFLRTLSKGVDRLEALTKTGDISGKDAFELYDTFGFPIDLTELMAGEIGLKVDMVGFKKELQNQKDRSRKSSKSTTSDWTELSNSINSQFVGYDENESVTNILRYRSVAEKNKTYYQVVLEKTPFYPEGGGQVGDRGLLVQDSNKMEVIDTTKENDLIVHKVLKLEGDLNASWIAKIDETNRSETQSNHTATHLLHFVLREVLGTHVEQKGSLVSPNYLRFDFSHFQKLSEKELGEIEFGVNRLIEQRLPLDEFRSIPIQEAKEKGAMSLFGEKYGDEVRMIQFGDSKELCGGTHVKNTSEIVRFKIVHESSVAAGIRRIEAITGKALFDYLLKTEEAYKSVLSVLGNPKSAIKSIEQLKNENQLMKKELKEFELLRSAQIRLKLKDEIVVGDNGIQTLVTKEDITAQQAKDLAFAFKAEYQNLFLALAYENAGKVGITILLSDTVANSTNLKANELIREIAPFIKGGGGGQPFFATAGGKNPEGIDEALALLKAKVVG
jgi:alanyl-tRNA synthetase